MCGNGDTTGSAVLWPGLARLFSFMTTPHLVKPVSREALMHALQRVRLTQWPRREITILAIDDDPMAVELVEAIVTGEGFRVLKHSAARKGSPSPIERCQRLSCWTI
jgi:hypothetical protein